MPRRLAARLLARMPLRGLPRRRSPTTMVEVLTQRERDVHRLLADGLGDRDIAVALTISRRTVETHVSSILHKLGVQNRTEAGASLPRRGLTLYSGSSTSGSLAMPGVGRTRRRGTVRRGRMRSPAHRCDLDSQRSGIVDTDLDPALLAHDQPQGARRVDRVTDVVQAVIEANPAEVHEPAARDVQVADQFPGGVARPLAALEADRASHRHDDLVGRQQRADPIVGFDRHDPKLTQALPGSFR